MCSQLWIWFADKLLAPLLLGAIFSLLFVFVFESHRARRDYLTRQVQSFVDDLAKFYDLAAEYWSSSADAKVDGLLAHKILLLEHDLRFAGMRIAEALPPLSSSSMANSLANLAAATTSGAFGEPDRNVELSRLPLIRSTVVHLRDEIQSARETSLREFFRIGH